MNKKDLPIILLQALNSLNTELFSLSKGLENLIDNDFNEKKLPIFKDSEKGSEFKFEIKNVSLSREGSPIFTVESAPSSKINNKPSLTSQNEKGTVIMFQRWIDWLKIYENLYLTPEDELQKKYQDEFYTEFEILEEDANKEPFSLKQQIYLNEYLTNSQEKLKLLAQSKSQEEQIEINNLISEAETIKKVLTKESKNKIIKRLSKFWGGARKTGIELIKEIFIEIAAEISKKILLG